jgi:hypothetical protein
MGSALQACRCSSALIKSSRLLLRTAARTCNQIDCDGPLQCERAGDGPWPRSNPDLWWLKAGVAVLPSVPSTAHRGSQGTVTRLIRFPKAEKLSDDFGSRQRFFRGWLHGLALASGHRHRLGCGDGAEYIEERGVGGNLQIKVDCAMHQDAYNPQHAC